MPLGSKRTSLESIAPIGQTEENGERATKTMHYTRLGSGWYEMLGMVWYEKVQRHT